MGKTSRVDQIPMLYDDDDSNRSVEMGALNGADDDDEDISQLYPKTGSTVAVKGTGRSEDPGKHEHLLRSGPMGKCNDPFCQTCQALSHFGENPIPQPKKKGVGKANQICTQAATWSRRCLPGILNPHTKIVNQWNKVFYISSGIAIFIDPLFFFLLSVDANDYCLVFNNNAAVAVTVFRTLTDSIHVCHIFFQFRLAYIKSYSKAYGELEDDPKKIAIYYLKGWFLLDLLTALPLPQILIWTVVRHMLGKENGANYAKNVLRVVVLVQNIPRSIRFIHLLIRWTPGGFVFNLVINLLMYLLAGHIVGSCWYLFGLQRVNYCMQQSCRNESIDYHWPVGNTSQNFFCQESFLDCGADKNSLNILGSNSNYTSWKKNTALAFNCLPLAPGSIAQFSYGIYLLGIPVYVESSVVGKCISSLFWGFLQISTLAGNQTPSPFVWEWLFTMGIMGLGFLLFALLIGNMQNFLQALQRRKLEMQLNRYDAEADTEAWMKQRKLPPSLRKRVKEAGRFRWVATGGVEEQELIKDLPEDLQKDIQRYLCLELVKKVRVFELLEEHVLDAICERLYQELYIEKSEILRSKKPVERMLFIVRGKLESHGDDGSIAPLKKGDFCGEELLAWYIDRTGVSTSKKMMKYKGKHPLSTRTVLAMTSVEAFSLDSEALEYITTHYKAAFRSPRVQGFIRYSSLFWRSQAANRIQKAWRAHRERKNEMGENNILDLSNNDLQTLCRNEQQALNADTITTCSTTLSVREGFRAATPKEVKPQTAHPYTIYKPEEFFENS